MLKRLPTFKAIPQAIGLPFLSSQEDAQLKFRSGDNGIKRLYGPEVVPMTDVAYWAQYYDLFNSASDVYSLISAQDIRQALVNQPQNLANLLLSLAHHLFTLVPSPDFPAPSSGSGLASTSAQNLSREALNCLRVLGRILVVVYEAEGEFGASRASVSASGRSSRASAYPGIGGNGDLGAQAGDAAAQEKGESFAQRWLWKREPALAKTAGAASKDGPLDGLQEPQEQFKIADDEDEDENEGVDTENDEPEDEDEDEITAGVRAFKSSVGNPPKQPARLGATKKKSQSTTSATTDPLTQAAAERSEVDTDLDGAEREEQKLLPCLADRLFGCTIDLLFCAGFTLPESVRSKADGEKINYVIWEKGVGSAVNIGSSGELDRNKVEVLRFLLILLSSTIYTPPAFLPSSPNVPLSNLTHSLERRLVLSLLCSFLNTSLAPAKPAAVSQLPYNHLISKSAEERRVLVRSCLMVLLVATDNTPSDEPSSPLAQGQPKEENAFRYFISKLHRKEDFAFILTGILGVLEEYNAVAGNLLPGSKRPVPYILETFMLLWRIIELNKRFRQYIYESGKTTDLVAYMLLCCLDQKDDPANHGLLRLLSYLLQTLSADQAFAQALVQPVRLAVPAKWAVAGSAADFLIVSIYSIATTPGLNSLFPALTISIANIAPYLQNIGVQASTRLLQLFKAFSAPNFLLADEGHPRLVYYLLETINSVLYHQLNENPNLVYAVLRSHQDFQTLATFTLMSGLRDIQRRKALRAERVAELAKKPDESKGLTRTNSELDMLAEKAALLGRDIQEDDEVSAVPLSPAGAPIPMPLTTPGETTVDPILSPSTAAQIPVPQPMSEKARGKLRATTDSISSLPGSTAAEVAANEIPDEELLRVAAAGVGPNGYVPTQEWVSSWQKGLPLDPVLVAISELLPKIQDSQARAGAPSSKVFNLLKSADLSDVLPPKPPIIPRRFQWSSASVVWLTSLLWGSIYVAGLTTVGVWKDTTVRLFGVKQAPVRRSAQESVGRVLKMIGVV